MRLATKVALITAAGSGTGRAGAIVFAREGATVVVADIAPEKGKETVSIVKQAGGEAVFVQADVSKLSDMQALVRTVDETYGRLDVLWNHAGTPGPEGIEGVEEADYEQAMSVLVKSGFFITKYALPVMRKSGGGSIIFTSSVAGTVASPFSPVYGAGKGAVVNLTRTLAVRLAPLIRVNCICPGPIASPGMPAYFARDPSADPQERLKSFLTQIPLGRVARPEEIALAGLFFASDESSFITGAILPVDGGFTAR